MKLNSFSIVIALILTGCFSNQQQVTTYDQCDTQNDYCIQFGHTMNNRTWTDNWSDSRGEHTDHTISNGLEPDDKNYIRLDFYSSPSCPPLGVTEPMTEQIGSDSRAWGRTDIWDKVDAMYRWEIRDEWRQGDTSPFCKPLFPSSQVVRKYVDCPPSPKDAYMYESETGVEWISCEQRQRNYEVEHGLYSAYAFCAEKDGKAVAICIQQMTDDEAMAKEIFESFRWTE